MGTHFVDRTQCAEPSAAEIRRSNFRVELFQSRQFDTPRALAWAERLRRRDADLDKRHICVECRHFRTFMTLGIDPKVPPDQWKFSSVPLRDWKCFKNEALLTDVLQRCPKFQWETPKQ